ncbi:MAG TPA: biotin-dependent carboxyltransferase family protein, partial [Propionicimonas sp.]
MTLEVVRSGPLSLVQDAGRPGLAAIGVTPSGAFDRTAFARGATLVGNDPALQAGIEVTLGGLSVRALAPVTVALTGAECPASVDDREADWGRPFLLGAGELLTLGLPRAGLRSYLSVAGGLDVPRVLGSRSTDILSGLGPPRLTAGMIVPVGRTMVPEELVSAADDRHEGPPTLPDPHEAPSRTVPEELREERTKRHEGPPTLPDPHEAPPRTIPEELREERTKRHE